MKRAITHVRSNAVAYVALFVALGGTSYAAFSLPAGSVGARQLRNHVITPVKLDPRSIAGSIRAWASVNAQGRITGSSSPARIVASVGADRVTWGVSLTRSCHSVASVTNPTGPEGPSSPAFADSSVVPSGRGKFGVQVSVYIVDGGNTTLARQPYVVTVVCPTPQR